MMMDRINKKWALIAGVWIAALCLNAWNLDAMDRIREARRKRVFLTMDEQFLRSHAAEISESLKRHEAFFHSAKALNLGLLTAEEDLKSLSERFGLTDVVVKGEAAEGNQGMVPLQFSCRGPLKNLVEWLEALRRDYAYMPVTRVTVEVDGPGMPARCEAVLKYRYKIVESDGGS